MSTKLSKVELNCHWHRNQFFALFHYVPVEAQIEVRHFVCALTWTDRKKMMIHLHVLPVGSYTYRYEA
jgi:hypothetical protein